MSKYKIGDDFRYKGKDYKVYDVFEDSCEIVIKRGFGINSVYIKLDKALLDGNNP